MDTGICINSGLLEVAEKKLQITERTNSHKQKYGVVSYIYIYIYI